jgi:hypothetical protein
MVVYGPVNDVDAGVLTMIVPVGDRSPLAGASVVIDVDTPL